MCFSLNKRTNKNKQEEPTTKEARLGTLQYFWAVSRRGHSLAAQEGKEL